MIGDIDSPYDLVFKSLKSVKKKSITLDGTFCLELLIKVVRYVISKISFFKVLKLNKDLLIFKVKKITV